MSGLCSAIRPTSLRQRRKGFKGKRHASPFRERRPTGPNVNQCTFCPLERLGTTWHHPCHKFLPTNAGPLGRVVRCPLRCVASCTIPTRTPVVPTRASWNQAHVGTCLELG